MSVSVRIYEVSSRFSIAETRTQRLKSGEVYGVVKTKDFEASLEKLVENKRAKVISAPTIRTLSGYPASFSSTRDGREEGYEIDPSVGEGGILLKLRGLTNKQEAFGIRLTLKADETLAITWKSGRQSMLTTVSPSVISG